MQKLLAICFLILGFGHYQIVEDEFTFGEFQKLHRALAPKDETWKSIPWHTSLLTAQRIAVEQKKLMFIWAMDGHPLGCT